MQPILLVDDEPEILASLKGLLRREFTLFTAQSGDQALEILSDHSIHVIMTDQRMPKMTGCEFLKRVYQKIPSKPPNRLILSGFSKTKDIEEAKKKYFLYMFISKPWEVDELRNIMNEAINNAFETNS